MIDAEGAPPELTARMMHPGGVPQQRGLPDVGARFQRATTLCP